MFALSSLKKRILTNNLDNELEMLNQLLSEQTRLNGQLKEQLQARDQEVQRLVARIKELEGQLAKNSQNSSKPPSSDGLKKPKPKSQRKNTGRNTGGQDGHPGLTLSQVADPDFVEQHHVHSCENCQCSLTDVEATDIECRQEFEIPVMKVQVTEHQADVKICPKCSFVNKGNFPDHITQPVQYGSRVKGLATYYNQNQLMPYQRLQDIFRDVHSLPLSEGTLFNTYAACDKKLEGFSKAVKQQLIDSKRVNFDESGMRVNKKLHWLHVASTEKLTHYEIHEKRGVEAMDEIGILPNFKGRAIHDHWKPYFNYTDCTHGLCNAHHFRELVYHEEQYEQAWCKKMRDCLLEIKAEVELLKEAGNDKMDPQRIKHYEQAYDRILSDGLNEIPILPAPATPKKRGKPKQHPTKNLWDRLNNFKKEVLAFMYDFTIPFTNNLGEQDIRMCKVKQKISGCFRSLNGAEMFCRTRGYISTARKNGLNVLDALVNVFKGSPFIPSSEISGNDSS